MTWAWPSRGKANSMELVIETFARTAIVFAWLILGFRLLGKRELGQMNVYDLVLVMAVANAVQNAMTQGSGALRVGMASAGTLLVLGWAASRAFTRHPRLESALVGTPTLLLQDGQFLPDHLRRERVTQELVLAALREHGLDGPEEARLVVMEVDGTLSVVSAVDRKASG